MDVFANYAVDEVAELNGVDVPIGDASFKIARAGNERHSKMLSAEVEKNKLALDVMDEAANKLSDKIMIDVMAETILLGWDDKVKYKGQPFPYSKENARELLSHKEFRKTIMMHSDNSAHFRAKLEEEVKN